MKFASLLVRAAAGAILAHSLRTATGILKKGRILDEADIAGLLAAGHTEVMAARLDADDVGEDIAAARLASALAGDGVTRAEAFTGRCNIYAAQSGLLGLDTDALRAVNAIDERLTVATLPVFAPVATGDLVATVKVIPFAVPDPILVAAAAAAGSGAVRCLAFEPARVGLVVTSLPGAKASLATKREQAVAARLAARGAMLAETRHVAHGVADVAAALADLQGAGCSPLLVFSASAIVDRGDVVPAAVAAAGGALVRLGMPVDPGNLLLMATLGKTPVIGIPSCASSPKLNGFDWVLDRVLAGLPVASADIAAMGIGGLLKEIPSRPQPREGGPTDAAAPASNRRAARVGVIVLAAGRASRMGSNKLVASLAGKSVVRHVVEAAVASRALHVVVVCGHEAAHVRAALAGLDVQVVDNPDFAAGLSTSLRVGLSALPADIDAALVCLGDMPEVTSLHMDRLIAAFSPDDGRDIIVPTRDGKRGNPVLWARAYFADMAAVAGDTGARHLLGQHADRIAEVAFTDDAIFADIDTPAALAAVRARHET